MCSNKYSYFLKKKKKKKEKTNTTLLEGANRAFTSSPY